MSNIIRCDDVDIRKINYVKPEKVGGSYFSSINYGDNLSYELIYNILFPISLN